MAAADGERTDDGVAKLETLDGGTNLIDDAGELMAHDEASAGGLMSTKDMELTDSNKLMANVFLLAGILYFIPAT